MADPKRFPSDRVRAGHALRNAVSIAKDAGWIANQEQLAERVGITSRSYISALYTGERPMNRSLTLRMADVLRCSAWDLANDEVRAELEVDRLRLSRAGKIDSDYVVIDRYARPTIEAAEGNHVGEQLPLRVPREWIAEHPGLKEDALRAVRLADEGMAKDLRAGDDAVVRTDMVSPIVSDEVYVLMRRGLYLPRRIVVAGEMLVISCDNRDAGIPVEHQTLEDLDASGTTIVGLVWWRFGRFRSQ